MKDESGVVLYVGKANRLPDRVSSYFLPSTDLGPRKQPMIALIAEFDFIPCEGEWEALLLEARLVKDLKPRFNARLLDDKTYPYLAVTIREEFPAVHITRDPAHERFRGARVYGPFTSGADLRHAVQLLQRVFQFRTCKLPIRSTDQRWRWFRPCILHSIRQCTAPCNLRVSREDYRRQVKRLILVLEGRKDRLLRRMERDMARASKAMEFEKAARLRDDIRALASLGRRGEVERDIQPEVFPIDPRKGLRGLRKILAMDKVPRVVEGIDIAHLGGTDTVASLVCFIDGLPFKPGYRRVRIRTVAGVDDYASIREVVGRRFTREERDDREEVFPDILLIDGGKGQLGAAREALDLVGRQPARLISLAKQNEEIFTVGQADPIVLSRHSEALRLLQAVRDEAHRFARHYHHHLRRKRIEDDGPSA